MRFKKPYTLVARRNKGKKSSKKRTWYYRVWNPVTGFQEEFSTNRFTKDAAERFCNELMASGTLSPKASPPSSSVPGQTPTVACIPTFKLFTKDMWTDACPICAARERNGKKLSRTYKELNAIRLKQQLLPAFGHLLLSEISTVVVTDWVERQKTGPRVVNSALTALSVMMTFAVRKGYVAANPCQGVERVKQTQRERKLLDESERNLLFFSEKVAPVWEAEPKLKLAAELAVRGGLRAGEILGLQVASLEMEGSEGWLMVRDSFDRKELKDVKSRVSNRDVPAETEFYNRLVSVAPKSGFVFSDDGGTTPISYFRFRKAYNKALALIGIEDESRKARGVGLHAFRHKLNTDLRKEVPDSAVRAAIGHATVEMTERYTAKDRKTVAPVRKAMKKIFKGFKDGQ